MTKILSIDWDYFVDADEEIMDLCFPDIPSDYTEFVSNIIWSRYYAGEMRDKLLDVSIEHKKLRYFDNWVKNVDLSQTSFVCASSHAYMMTLFNGVEDKGNVEIVNIDFHHDNFLLEINDTDFVNCGNWLTYLLHNYNIKATWIKNEKSYEDEIDSRIEITDSLSVIDNFMPDYIFLCKSYAWTPPHLDKYFIKLFKLFSFCCKDVILYDSEVVRNRFEPVMKMAETEREMMRELGLEP